MSWQFCRNVVAAGSLWWNSCALLLWALLYGLELGILLQNKMCWVHSSFALLTRTKKGFVTSRPIQHPFNLFPFATSCTVNTQWASRRWAFGASSQQVLFPGAVFAEAFDLSMHTDMQWNCRTRKQCTTLPETLLFHS